jgi:hypothetical protein
LLSSQAKRGIQKKLAPDPNEVLFRSVKIINYIKNSASNTRLLKALCDEMGSDQQNLLFHSEDYTDGAA